MRSILSGVTLVSVHWDEVHNPAIVEGNHHLEQEVLVATGHALVQMQIMVGLKPRKKT